MQHRPKTEHFSPARVENFPLLSPPLFSSLLFSSPLSTSPHLVSLHLTSLGLGALPEPRTHRLPSAEAFCHIYSSRSAEITSHRQHLLPCGTVFLI